MEVQKTSIGDITWNGHTFKNITEQMKKVTPREEDPFPAPEPREGPPDGYSRISPDSNLWVPGSPEQWRLKASRELYRASGAYGGNTGMTEAAKAINKERDEAIGKFLDGDMSQEELADTFERLLNKFRAACDKNDYPTPLGLTLYEDEGMSAAFYSDFRAQILKQAVQRNDDEGKRYITDPERAVPNWKYYNSDYYFLSEDALAAAEKGLEQFLEHVDVKGYKLDIPDYKAEGKNECYNFNSAWSAYQAGWDADQFMKDFDAVPPKGFEWFYQSGGDAKRVTRGIARLVTDGVPAHVPFDPKDPSSATTWAAYRDSSGKRHFVSKDFAYDGTENDLKTVSSLLRFTGNKEEDEAFNRFMDNLQVCKSGYFYRFGLIKPVELWA